MSTRRYQDEEVREIFSLATTGGTGERPVATDSGGLTLEQLQQVAQEAGIDPGRVRRAAASLDARGRAAPIQRAFGLPIGVTRVVDLPRAPTDREWEQLIAECRTTFGAPGHVTTSGGLREWSNGNLHMCVEPTARGEQLRLTTRSDGAVALNVLAMVTGGMSLLMGATITAAGKPDKALLVFGMFGSMALVALAANVLRLPRWARERERQMEALAEHAVTLLSDPA